MFHHIIKLSSTAAVVKAAARKFSSTEAAAARPISVLYPKINHKVLVNGVMEEDKKRSLIDEGNNDKKPAAEGPPPPPPLKDEDEDEVSLRPFQLSDVDDIMAWGTDEELSRYCRWQIFRSRENYCGWEKARPLINPGYAHKHYGWDLLIYKSKGDALNDMKYNILPHPWYRAICLKNNRPIGKIFVDPCRPINPYMAEIGFVVASEHSGKGIATTAVEMAMDAVYKEWPWPHLRRFQALVHVENLAGQRVLQKAGFTKDFVISKYFLDKEGRRIDIQMLSFLRRNHKSFDPACDILKKEDVVRGCEVLQEE